MNLDKLRKHLSAVDRELLQLVARRQRIVAEIGSTKIKADAISVVVIKKIWLSKDL